MLLLGFQPAPLAQADETWTLTGTLKDKNGPVGGVNVCADPVDSDVGITPHRECVASEVGTGAYTITKLVHWQYRLVVWDSEKYPVTYFGIEDTTTSDPSAAAILDQTMPMAERNIVLVKPPLDLTPTPKVTGKAKAGFKLTAKPGAWTAGVTLKYQWLRKSFGKTVEIPGASRPTYKVQRADGGSTLAVRVTGSMAARESSSQDSVPTKAVPLSKLKAGKVRITAAAGILTAKPGKWTAGVTFTYQWQANGKPLLGATRNTLAISPELVGKAVKVKVTGTKQGYKTVTKISSAKKVR